MFRIAPAQDHPAGIQQLHVGHVAVERDEFFQIFLDLPDGCLIRLATGRDLREELDDADQAAFIAETGTQQAYHGSQLALLRIHGKEHLLIHALPQEMVGQRGADACKTQQSEQSGRKYAQQHFGKQTQFHVASMSAYIPT